LGWNLAYGRWSAWADSSTLNSVCGLGLAYQTMHCPHELSFSLWGCSVTSSLSEAKIAWSCWQGWRWLLLAHWTSWWCH
jgi:hypothetical protein